jgi:hypothetical protein
MLHAVAPVADLFSMWLTGFGIWCARDRGRHRRPASWWRKHR